MQFSRVLAALCGVLLCASGLFAASGDFCDSSLCLNGGTCLMGQDNDIYCLCPEGFTGLVCNETEKGPCSPNPCFHDAKCLVTEDTQRGDIFTEYICQCPVGYSGIHCELGCSTKLGLEGGAIADSQISASSVYMGFMGLQRWGPELARLYRTGIVNAWTASSYDSKPWIQVDFLRKMRVSGVMTQGASRAGRAEYLKTFKVAYSLDGRRFEFIQDESGTGDKEFMGNQDNNSLKINMFNPTLEAQYIRLYPVSCHRGCTLRFELLGCELHGCSEPLGLKNNTIPDSQITASSSYKTWNLRAFGWYPHLGRLDNQGKINAWTAQSNSAKEWLQVDLGTQKKVTGIITQGARDFGHIQYVASYKVAHSDDGVQWTVYEEQGTSKVFQGNLDNNSHKKNIFEKPFMARYVRVLPLSWHNRITLRLELLGC
ncbi:milk fat globule-EGF factor 8 protein, isoform CRA_a [Rattus norvegicus]|uniref:Lactadherin n=2 Tax=Rattus norvegicus TaxID=10116 RepID=MFGM_RAT|nr:lactadherin isoform 2 precursor [Rattus norvegicus]P70490.1 RecName: Full=Lactadherin; AltName: Full=MFGM; AltName: Full=Milk fat globule-EGF factor 8; Short=MFG-E8; AltName: Full=O-acetyl GD3 ganglioside synthase; Short=AGS; AltName: Full=SED1; Flags: Precursor [Rattus norvegicus]AAH85754.1 Milk fat globule-EGF factor 8 protein [Rattus norvegicus]EDM08572.1 milk fat globule-EGF factor 8 protein, isoform CRA_a [Rattus norvegicus]BAA12210.1 O-acetyl GD3 ganglioside synthase [Rattus norvegicus|eukprot:NP_036943.1 lactadherin isoform 2 precursor [Rattus norvegicus]